MNSLHSSAVIGILIISMHTASAERNTGSYTHETDTTQDKQLFSFGLIADAQYADDEPSGSRYYRSAPVKIQEAVGIFRKDSVDFAVNLGDLIDRDFGSYQPVMDILGKSEIRFFHVTGNHDYSVRPDLKENIPVRYGSDEGYFAVTRNNFRLLFLDGNEISVYASANESDSLAAANYIRELAAHGAINAMTWNGGISQKQKAWIVKQCMEAEAASEKVIILCHFPVEPENMHNLLNYREILAEIIQFPNVVAWLSGHNHEGNYSYHNKVHFLTFRGMVETQKSNSYAVIKVFRNRLEIVGYGRENSAVLSF